jgi:hypothetical protein
MNGSIPADFLVQVIPGVLPAAGSPFSLNGMVATKSVRVPIGTVASFSSGPAVTSFFGAGSQEDIIANGGASLGSGYFAGINNATQVPGNLLFVQDAVSAVSAYVWGGNFAGSNTVAQMQALSGSLTVVMDGYTHVISSINLSGYSSYSAAAAGISAAFTDPTEANFTASLGASFTATAGSPSTKLVVTAVTGLISVGDTVSGTGIPASTTIVSQDAGGTPGGAGTYNLSAANTASSASCTSTSTILDVTVNTDHNIAVGQTVVGSGVTGAPVITSQLTGTAGTIGTYRISGAQQSVASESMTGTATAPVVTFDSLSGAFVITSGITGAPSTSAFATGTLADPLLLTSATGAYLSQGSAAMTPSVVMSSAFGITQNWASYMTAFDPDNGSGNTQKQAFAAWKNAYNNRFAYVCWDTDVTPTESVPATGSLGYILKNNGDSGTILVYEGSDLNLAQGICAYGASLNFSAMAGRTTLAGRSQAGLAPSVVNEQIAANLGGSPLVAGSFGNGYNYYGAFATANQAFTGYQRGTVTGPFQWADSYFNQIYMRNQFQLDLMELLQNTNSISYNPVGNSMVETALADTIQQMLDFGAITENVTLSSSQIAEVNQDAGANIAGVLQTRGWYLQIGIASPTSRQSRSSPPITFWYVDGGSVQAIRMASIVVQ